MSLPVTDEERRQAAETTSCAGLTENLVSTACPACAVRFALLGKLDAAGWHLRCTCCDWTGNGELK